MQAKDPSAVHVQLLFTSATVAKSGNSPVTKIQDILLLNVDRDC
jgi:hypothetical protein